MQTAFNVRLLQWGKENAIVIYKGMLDAIFKIAVRVVETEALFQVANKGTLSLTTPARPLSVKALLGDAKDFVWNEKLYPWIANLEHKALFMFTASFLLRFVIFHELGHLLHRHGERSDSDNLMNVDEMSSNSEFGSLNSQARELVADMFAFQELIGFTKEHLISQANNEIGTFLTSELIPNDFELVVFCLQMAHVYFFFMDSEKWRTIAPTEWSHPPHPFRLHTIYTAFLSEGFSIIKAEYRNDLLGRAILLGQKTVQSIIGTPIGLDWSLEMGESKYKEHFDTLHALMPRWTDTERTDWQC
ncbi:hypothetical protein [Undibacterium sp.]|uniref:ImmA/IrrE family metallo-endopeptidase n=1 Tax=Undibacterium sp. TaxID=1914977 RepID=UPI0025E5E65F|nr:hypothetical protein [Undibacterium sp.]